VMLVAASCSASAPAPVAPRPTVTDGAPAPPPPPAAAPPPLVVTAPPPDAGPTGCARPALEGSWLLKSGTASLTCDDGSKSSVPAGGTIRVERTASGLVLADGRCRYPLTENGCSLVGTAGAACADGGVRYSAREITISRDGAGGVALVYSLDQPDPERKGGRCVASSVAKLAHAAEPNEDCALDGRWEASLPGRPSLAVKENRCTIAAGARQSEGPCRRQGARLSVTEALPRNRGACRPGARADYAISFAQGCAALTLEARSDACAARRDAIEYVFFEKQRP
jgi:hypothetical protein